MKAITTTPGVSNSLAIKDVPDPQIGEEEVLVEVVRVGVCGTDLEIKAGMYGEAPPGSDYLIIGHEALGQVVEVGPRVKGFDIGDYVLSSVRRPCPLDWCLPCRSGQNDMCITGDYRERGIKGQHGFLSEYYSEHELKLTKIPARFEKVGAFLEPLSIVEKALRQTFKIQQRLPWKIENAVVLGAGTIGLLGAMLLRLKGISTYALDQSDSGGVKSQLLSQLGAHHVDSRTTPLSDVAAEIGPIDFVLEATGYAPLVFEASRHLAMDGLLCLVGVSGGSRNISIDANVFNNDFVLGNRLVFGSVNANLMDFQSGARHIRQISKQWPGALETMMTRRTSFSQFQAAFERQPEDIKVVVEMDSLTAVK